MASGSTPYVGMAPKKLAATLKVHKWHNQNVSVRLVKGLHDSYQALLSASMGNETINFAGEVSYQESWTSALANRSEHSNA